MAIKKRVQSNKWIHWFIVWSHIFGWAVAWIQTMWLMKELKRSRWELQEDIKGVKRNLRGK